MATDEFEDVEVVDVEPDPAALWSDETVLTKKTKESTVLSGGVNLLNTIIGAGILSIPFAMARQGLIFGTILCLLVAFLTHYSMTLLGRVGERLLNDYYSYKPIPLPDRSTTPSSTPSIAVSDTTMTPRQSMEVAKPEAHEASGRKSMSNDGDSLNIPTTPTERPQSPAGIFHGSEAERTPSTSLDLLRTQTPSTVALNKSASPSNVLAQHQQTLKPRVTFPWVTTRIKPWLAVVLDIGMVVFCLGVCVAYLILIGDSMPQVIGFIVDERPDTSSIASLSESFVDASVSSTVVSYPVLRRRELWMSIALICISPFIISKRLDVLRYLSWGTVICVFYMLFMLIYYFIRDFDRIFSDDNSYDMGPTSSAAVNNISIFLFSYTCQPNYYAVFDEIGERNRRKRANMSSAVACAASGILYSLFGIFGYFIGGRNVASNVVNSLPTYDTVVLIARLALIFVVTFSYPVVFHPMRVCFEAIINGPRCQKISETARRIIVAVVLALITWVIAMIFEQLDVVLALSGATGATLLSFILPGYMIWLAFPEKHSCPGGWIVISGLVLCIFGIVFMVASVVLTFVNL